MKPYRPTLNFYLAHQYTTHIVSLMVILLAVMAMFDAIELMRRLSEAGALDPRLMGYLTFLKVPRNILTIAPFIVLFASMFTFSVLNRRQELTVMRTAGASLWQLMLPFFVVAFLFGTVLTTIINPLSAVTERVYAQYEQKFLKKETHMIALLGQGLWLRQTTMDDQGKEKGYLLLHAGKVQLPEWHLDQVTVLSFTSDHQFINRLDAANATLQPKHWLLPIATLTTSNRPPETLTNYLLGTTLTRSDLEESFSAPETISFWQLPSFIRQLKISGFPVGQLQVHFGALVMLPFLCAALIMVAMLVSIRPARVGGQVRLIIFGICAGFAIFFANNFLQALGASGQIPIWLAATGPAILTAAAGIMAILSLEDQ